MVYVIVSIILLLVFIFLVLSYINDWIKDKKLLYSIGGFVIVTFLFILFCYVRKSYALFSVETNEIEYNVTVPNEWLYRECSSGGESICDSGTYVITGYNGSDTILTFPSEINGVKVSSISNGSSAISGSVGNVKSIIIPEGYVYIGNYAFYQYSNIKTVTLPESLKRVGNSAFLSTGITSVIVPSNVESIGASAFIGFSMADVTIKGKCGLGDFKVYGTSTNRTIASVFGSGVTAKFPDCKFTNELCNTNIVADSGCETDTYVITGFTEKATSLKPHPQIPIKINGKYVSSVYNNGEALNNLSGTSSILFRQDSDSRVYTIGVGAFKGTTTSKNVYKITLPPNLKTINSNAFDYTKFSTITIPASVGSIARGTFQGNTDLKTINVEGKCASGYSSSWNTITWGGADDKVINWNGTNCN